MAESGAAEATGLYLCESADLIERGRAVGFHVVHFRQPARAFALRFDGAVVAYLNRCVHVPTEMDWQDGEFLDSEREFIICSIHGATYEPRSGRCAGGLAAEAASPVSLPVNAKAGCIGILAGTRYRHSLTRPATCPSAEPLKDLNEFARREPDPGHPEARTSGGTRACLERSARAVRT